MREIEHHSSNYCKQDPPMNAEITGVKCKERQDTCITSVSPPKYLLTIKGKIVNFTVEKPG